VWVVAMVSKCELVCAWGCRGGGDVQCVIMCLLRESIIVWRVLWAIFNSVLKRRVVVNVMDLMNEVWRHRKMCFERNNSLGRNNPVGR
jgi:hypothetical protein